MDQEQNGVSRVTESLIETIEEEHPNYTLTSHHGPDGRRYVMLEFYGSDGEPNHQAATDFVSMVSELDADPEEEMRQVVREEIRRNEIGARCPNCRETNLGIGLDDIERQSRGETETSFNCMSCEYGGPMSTFDPENQ